MIRAIISGVLVGLPLALAVAGPADASERAAIVQSCQRQMFLSQGACGCLADHALAELNPMQQQWLEVPATDVVRSAAMSKKMSSAEMLKIDAFMKQTPDLCAGK
jgi:hypothetical protein